MEYGNNPVLPKTSHEAVALIAKAEKDNKFRTMSPMEEVEWGVEGEDALIADLSSELHVVKLRDEYLFISTYPDGEITGDRKFGLK